MRLCMSFHLMLFLAIYLTPSARDMTQILTSKVDTSAERIQNI